MTGSIDAQHLIAGLDPGRSKCGLIHVRRDDREQPAVDQDESESGRQDLPQDVQVGTEVRQEPVV